MGEFPCERTKFKPGPKQQAIARKAARKGGLVRGPAKSLGQKIRWMKEKGDITDERANEILEFFQSPELGAQQILDKVEELREYCDDPQALAVYARLKTDIHKQVHGTKSRNTNLNVDVNVDEVADKLIGKLLGVEDEKKK